MSILLDQEQSLPNFLLPDLDLWRTPRPQFYVAVNSKILSQRVILGWQAYLLRSTFYRHTFLRMNQLLDFISKFVFDPIILLLLDYLFILDHILIQPRLDLLLYIVWLPDFRWLFLPQILTDNSNLVLLSELKGFWDFRHFAHVHRFLANWVALDQSTGGVKFKLLRLKVFIQLVFKELGQLVVRAEWLLERRVLPMLPIEVLKRRFHQVPNRLPSLILNEVIWGYMTLVGL